MALKRFDYNREKAVAYAHRWAYFRNPEYYDFSDIGGDCTSFASQCLFAGSGIMNYQKPFGWFYISADDRTASWTGVNYLYNFLVKNEGPGPYATETALELAQPGDIIQLILEQPSWQHSPVVVAVRGKEPTADDLWVAAHSYDCDCRPLASYPITQLRCLHIEGVRY